MQSPVERLIRPQIWEMEGYVPVEPLEALAKRHGISLDRIIKLDANENPYGCSIRVQEALASFDRYQIYPDPFHEQARALLEKYTGMSRDRIMVGSGSDELIDLIVRLFVGPDDEIINCPPSFGMYYYSANVAGARVVDVQRDEKFALDLRGIQGAISERTKLIFLASPNNPTGNSVEPAEVVELLKHNLVVVVDEAYYEFAGRTLVPLVGEFDNLIVLRTFSKWAGLAGLRVGYGVFPPEVIKQLWKIKQPYNVNVAAQLAVEASLDDLERLQTTVQWIRKERGRLFRQLRKINYLEPYPSQANFILCKVLRGEALQVMRELEKNGIFIRYYNTPLLSQYIRISVGKPEDTDALVKTLLRTANSL
ncbi:MAG: histidinol-phosphate transaminase [Chloroflexi bacterium]|nr:histidinol-phosphate transaminase [Chloroflexota bacterium]